MRVEKVMKAGTGKSFRVQINGEWYGAKLDSGIEAAEGKEIDAEIETTEKFGKWIRKWTVVSGASKATGGNGTQPYAPWFMPFVSNTVAHAISAGKIEGPAEIQAWASAAKSAAETIASEGEGPDF